MQFASLEQYSDSNDYYWYSDFLQQDFLIYIFLKVLPP